MVLDQSGTWTNREEYTPYGETSFGGFARKRYGYGGKEMDELFITTAWTSLSEAQIKEQKQAGDLFRIKMDVKGIPEAKFKG